MTAFPKPPPPGRDSPRIVDPGTGTLSITVGALLMIAALLPWLSYPGFGGGLSISGLDTDGQETLVCGLVVLVLGILAKTGKARPWAAIVGVVFGAIAVLSVGYRIEQVLQHRSEGSEVSPAFGLYVSVPLSLLCLFAAIRCLRNVGPADWYDR